MSTLTCSSSRTSWTRVRLHSLGKGNTWNVALNTAFHFETVKILCAFWGNSNLGTCHFAMMLGPTRRTLVCGLIILLGWDCFHHDLEFVVYESGLGDPHGRQKPRRLDALICQCHPFG